MDVELKRILSILRNKGSLTNGVPTSETFSNVTDSAEAVSDNVGQQGAAATNDNMSDIATTPAMAKLRLILNRLSSDAFTATIQGAARTEVDTMLAQIATYLSAAGAAWSVQINNNLARTNLEQVIEDLSVVLGCDNANIFNPSIGGATRTDMDAAFAALGTALGAEYDGTPDLYDVTVTGHDSSAVAANEDGSIDERLEQIQEVVNRGAGTSVAAGKSLVDAIGSDGNALIDTATSVVGVLGVDDADNAFSSVNVLANEDGSVLERLEQIQEAVNRGAGTSVAAGKSLVDALGSDGTTVTDSAVSVLGAVGANNNNNAFSSSSIVANSDGSVLERLESLLLRSSRAETLPTFTEFFVDEAGLQAQYWTTATTGTGAVTRQYSAPYVEVILNNPAGTDTANLYSVQRWFVAPDTYGVNTVVKTLNLEFLAKVTSVANLDNAGVFLGFATAQGATRASNNIIGFILAADVLTSLTDDGAVETTNDASAGTTITNWVKYRTEIYSAGVRFYTNETLRTTHITNLPDQSMYLNFYSITEAVVAGSIELAQLRVWYTDE